MAHFDLPLKELEQYRPDREEPTDFDAFWARTLKDHGGKPEAARFEPVDIGLKTLETFDVTFSGFGGQPIRGWFVLPRDRKGPLPCVVEYLGYGGGRGFAQDWLFWASAGFAHLLMDTRGQGSAWSRGDTPDPEAEGTNPHFPGFMTRGILSPDTYYYRRVFSDGVAAVETAARHAAVDPERIAITGGSQGGGITLAVAGLSPRVKVAMADVPFLCHFRRALRITDSSPYQEIVQFSRVHRDRVDQVFKTLGYFDGMNFAARAKANGLISVGLMDDICPPSTVYAAYNHYAGPKEVRIYEFNKHEGGQSVQTLEKLKYLRRIFPA